MVKGSARFTLAGEAFVVPAMSLVAVPDTSVTRGAVANEDGTLIVAVGSPADSGFHTTWRKEHFEQVPQAD